MKKLLVVAGLIIIGAGIILAASGKKSEPPDTSNPPPPPPPIAKNTILITADGFAPRELTIERGETVTFVNQTDNPSWPASDIHPSHTLYPGSGIGKCGTEQAGNIFDACHGLGRGESFTFTFNEIGGWRFHDHLNPSLKGKIIVTE